MHADGHSSLLLQVQPVHPCIGKITFTELDLNTIPSSSVTAAQTPPTQLDASVTQRHYSYVEVVTVVIIECRHHTALPYYPATHTRPSNMAYNQCQDELDPSFSRNNQGQKSFSFDLNVLGPTLSQHQLCPYTFQQQNHVTICDIHSTKEILNSFPTAGEKILTPTCKRPQTSDSHSTEPKHLEKRQRLDCNTNDTNDTHTLTHFIAGCANQRIRNNRLELFPCPFYRRNPTKYGILRCVGRWKIHRLK
ncbi:hypothetical protein EDB80DRAFT_702740 [Ilyonectria destructans]|nr:hypothetical protein EDB80DRAFT_702740 [Ilyonectria destructans]